MRLTTALSFFEFPSRLDERYEEAGHDDETYDPFGYSLTLGPKAEIDSDPEWEVDLDFQEGIFEILTRNADLHLEEILRRLSDYFPDVSLVPIETLTEEKERRVIGRIEPN